MKFRLLDSSSPIACLPTKEKNKFNHFALNNIYNVTLELYHPHPNQIITWLDRIWHAMTPGRTILLWLLLLLLLAILTRQWDFDRKLTHIYGRSSVSFKETKSQNLSKLGLLEGSWGSRGAWVWLCQRGRSSLLVLKRDGDWGLLGESSNSVVTTTNTTTHRPGGEFGFSPTQTKLFFKGFVALNAVWKWNEATLIVFTFSQVIMSRCVIKYVTHIMSTPVWCGKSQTICKFVSCVANK